MSTSYGPQVQDRQQEPLGWPGPGGPDGPGGPAGGGWEGSGGPVKRRRRGLIITVAAVAVAVAAAGSGLAAARSGSTSLSRAQIAAKIDPGLVDITSTLGYQRAVAEGTGMVLTAGGEVLTNNHVIAGATSIKARDIGSGRTYTAVVVGYSENHDVAVLQLRGASGLATVSLGDSSSVAAGQHVVALGNALGKGGTPAVATGKVTAVGSSVTATDQGDGVSEHLTGLIRTDAGIQPGDSGGPLVNRAGQVIAMDTAASTSTPSVPGTTSTATTASGATTAFSIPINEALSVARQIEAGQSSASVHVGATGFLGVALVPAGNGGFSGGQAAAGALVEGVVQGKAAAQAGLTEGDVITSLGGVAISSASDVQKVIEGHHPGDRISITWTDQAGQTHSATVVLTTGPAG
jgi:S1-C subfamily serine protease